MNGCQFPQENVIGTGFRLTLDVDQCEVESHRYCEIPVAGPGLANTLVMITGIAVPAADVGRNEAETTVLCQGDIWIKTDYIVRSPDQWQHIANDPKTGQPNEFLLQATNVTLATIFNEQGTNIALIEPEEGEFTFAVNDVVAQVNTDGRVQIWIRAAAQGDVTLARIAYHANILIRKATPGLGLRQI